MSRSVPKLIEALLAAGRWPDPELVEALAARGREAEGELAHIIRSDLRRRPGEASLPVLVGVAGEVGGPELARDLVALYRRYDDDTLEHVNGALVRIGADALPPLLELIADRSVRWYGRAMAAAAAVKVARPDPVAKERVASELRHLLAGFTSRGGLSDAEQLFAASLVWGLASLPDAGGKDAIAAAFGAQIITERSVTPETVGDAYRRAQARPVAPTVPFPRAYRDYYERMVGEPGPAAAEKPSEKPSEKKPGRNDPCWCGSGKKYKRCHLDNDVD